LFGGPLQSINVALGINQNPTVITTTVIRDGSPIVVANRQLVNISIGALQFRGIVQSWDEAKTDIAGTGVYQVRLTDTKPVLNAAQVIIGSSFDDTKTQAYDYGDNVIPIIFQTSSQMSDGIPFSVIMDSVEDAEIRYGNQTYTVNFNFTLPTRGSAVEYSLRGRAFSLSELISQIADDHGLDWYVTTSASNVISINMFGRTNITDITVNQLAALHPGAVERRHEGLENRDAVQKVVLVGGYKSVLSRSDGSLWEQFWGFEENGRKRAEPLYTETIMENIINNNFTPEEYTEESVQRILSYANEFWGRKFISEITPPAVIDSNGRSWVVPTSAGWNESDSVPMDFNLDGQLKFQTNDGRWITFITLPLPGSRWATKSVKYSYEWDDELFSNPNSHIDDDGNVAMKSSLETIDNLQGDEEDQYFLITLATPLRVKSRQVAGSAALSDVVTKTRATQIGTAYLALLDQRETYGPWANRESSIGRTEVIIDASLTPWSFGYRGITNSIGIDLLTQVARAKIKTVADTTMDAKTAELAVAGVPAINIGDQLHTTGVITSMNVVFAVGGVKTIYKARQHTTELSKHLKQQQDLLDRLRRQAAEFNNTMQPPQDDFATDRTIQALKKELPEPPVNSESEGTRRKLQTLLGRIYARSSTTEPKYNITPMAWVADTFGELTLVRNTKVFGTYLNVVNMGEPQTAPGRLIVGTDVTVNEFSVTDGGIVSYYINVSAPKPPSFTALIKEAVSNLQPTYKVIPVVSAIQQINLLPTELLVLNAVLNIGEPANYPGYLGINTEVSINWNENSDGSYTPFIEQQLNLFKPF